MERLSLGLLALALAGTTAFAEGATIRLVEFESPITPLTAVRITQAIDDAEQAGDDLVLIELDTPGGYVDSTEKIVKRMLAAEVPIVVWVGPAGAKAASGGLFVLIAADVAAMAPGTRTGASSVVYAGGESREDDVLLKKANEDLAALARSVAEHRGRDAQAAERAVFEAKAYEEQVALEQKLIDLIAPSRDDLLKQLDGKDVRRFDGSVVVLHTADARFAVSEFSLRQEFMELLEVPWVAAFLLLAGMLGIYVEFTHPGVVFPGVAGALCLLLFALAAQALPISTIGVLLILLALVMFLLEIKVVSYGMLTVGGALSLAIGVWMLVEGPIPELRVPVTFVVPVALAVTGVCAFVVRLAVRSQRARPASGREGLLGEIGTVSDELAPAGRVFVHGESWGAVSSAGTIPGGARVRVVGVEGLTLIVAPAGGAAPASHMEEPR
jgi:membrane-bound serine protease (ClpP class)